MHLQWFAAEDEGRTEEPTEHKIRKAREEGNVAKSPEVPAAIVLLAVVITLAFFAPYYVRTLREMLRFFLSRSGEVHGALEGPLYFSVLNYFARLILPVFVPALLSAVIGNVIQFGFLFSLKPVTPDPGKLIPKFSQFFKQAVFSAAAVFNLAKSLLKVIIIAAIAYTNIRSSFGEIVDSMNAPFLQSAEKMALTAFFIVLESALVLLVMAFFDYLFQKRQHREALKMTREELKREHKEFEGDPLVRSRLRRMMRDMLTQDIGRAVPQATVVVTNPTHFAVAIEHSDDWKDVPTVTAKGQDNLAQTIKRIAKNSGVPLVENVQLARALYAAVNVGDEIPHQFYEAVAAVLRYVYSMNADTSRRLEKLGEEAHV